MEQHTCPICGRAFPVVPRRATFPFCSPRCKMVDLGNWLDGAYRIPAQDDELFSENTGDGRTDQDGHDSSGG